MPHLGTQTMPSVLGISSSPRLKSSAAIFESLSGTMLQGLLEKIQELSGFRVEAVHLSLLKIHPCRGCFSDMETRCHFLCDCYDDDFKMIAGKMMAADGIIFATPTYMFGMTSVLKKFLERWISFKAPRIDQGEANKSLDECFDLLHRLDDGTLDASNPLKGKVGALVVAGSELGQDNVIRELMMLLNLYGFVFPPQAFVYHTGHSMQSLEEVRRVFYENKWLEAATETLAHNFVQMVRLTRKTRWHEIPRTLVQE
ncbi:MAG: flavodoxin family protein [Desulfomonilaceae bacterium]